MDRPSALVAWYYTPYALVLAFVTIAGCLRVPLLVAIAVLVLALGGVALTVAYRRITGRQPATLTRPAARLWAIGSLVVMLGLFTAGWRLCVLLHAAWPAWAAGAIIAAAVIAAGGAYETRRRASHPEVDRTTELQDAERITS